MAKYTQEFLTQVLAADEFDVLEVEFIARAAGKVAASGAVIHDCQVETLKINMDIKQQLDDRSLPANDPWRMTCESGADVTIAAQGKMWNALGDIAEALAKRVKRA